MCQCGNTHITKSSTEKLIILLKQRDALQILLNTAYRIHIDGTKNRILISELLSEINYQINNEAKNVI